MSKPDEQAIVNHLATALMKGIEIKSLARKQAAWQEVCTKVEQIRKQLREIDD